MAKQDNLAKESPVGKKSYPDFQKLIRKKYQRASEQNNDFMICKNCIYWNTEAETHTEKEWEDSDFGKWIIQVYNEVQRQLIASSVTAEIDNELFVSLIMLKFSTKGLEQYDVEEEAEILKTQLTPPEKTS